MDKAPEFCLLWINSSVTCMTKSEWAAWAQFVGAFISLNFAIGWPLWLEYQRKEKEKEDYLNARKSLNKFKDDVIQFVGHLTFYSLKLEDLVIDQVQYDRILERLSYFDRFMHDPSATILLGMIRNSLRSIDGYRHNVDDRERQNANIISCLRKLNNARFDPDREDYLFGQG